MRCRTFQRLFLEVEETPNEEQGAALTEHMAQCPHCARFAREMQAVARLVRESDSLRAPTGFCGRVMERIREGEEEADFRWRRSPECSGRRGEEQLTAVRPVPSYEKTESPRLPR
jgi:hypothetical protein